MDANRIQAFRLQTLRLQTLLPPRFQGQLTPLAGGLTNHCWQLDTQQARYWVRLGNTNSECLGINRIQELHAHQAAASAGLAPTIKFANPECGLLILDWLDEPNWQQTTPNMTLLMRKVAQLHQLSAPLATLDLAEQAALYLSQLHSISPVLAAYHAHIKLPECNLSYQPVLCHHDLNAENILGARPWLLDWEYAAYGDAAFELAVIADSFNLDQVSTKQLVSDYHAYGGQVSWPRFQARRPWVQWLTALWAALQYQYTAQQQYLEMQQQALIKLEKLVLRKRE